MVKTRLYKYLSKFVDLNPGEEIIALLLFLYFFLITAPFSIAKALRDAFYLDILSYKKLPIAYLLTAVIIGFVVHFHSKLQALVQENLLLSFSLVFFILTGLFFWWAFPNGWEWTPLVFWVWVNMLAVILVTQFWVTIYDVFNPRETKRMIGFLGSGGILGGVVGYEIAGLLAKSKASNYLLLIAVGMFIAGIFVIQKIFGLHRKRQTLFSKGEKKRKEREEKKPRNVGFKDSLDTVRKDSYLRLLAVIVALTLIVSTFIDFQFKGIVNIHISGQNSLKSFFGHFYAALTILSFFLQLFLTSRIIKRYGIRLTLLFFPILLLLGSLGIAVTLSLVFAILLKGSEKSFYYSINQSVEMLLYIPISEKNKTKAKVFIEMFINRFAKGVGALILMIFVLIPLSLRLVSLFSVLFIFLWIFLNIKVSREYVSKVKNKLEKKWDRAEKLVAEKMDMDYAKLVFDTLQSKNRSSVLYAMHLFDLIKQDKLTPELKKIISHKSDEIKATSLGVLMEAEETTLPSETENSTNEESMKKEIEEIMSLGVYKDLIENHVGKIMSEQQENKDVAKMEVAKALGMMDTQSPLTQKLEALLNDNSPEVSKYAIESAARLKKKEYIPFLVRKLSSPPSRDDAASALEKYGQEIIGTLGNFLTNPKESKEVKKELSRVMARIGSPKSVNFLLQELAQEKGELDSELIDALDKIRGDNPNFLFPDEMVKGKMAQKVKKHCWALIDFFDSLPQEKKEQAEKLIPPGIEHSLANIFQLLGLIYPHEDITKAYQNIKVGTKESTAYAVELTDNTLEREIRGIILPLIEDITLERRVIKCRNLLKSPSLIKLIKE